MTDFTPAQRRIIAHDRGHAVVLSVAGSGKTTTLTARAARLVRERRTTDERLLLVTFSKKASEAMTTKLDQLLPGNGIEVRTFHSWCLARLKEYAEAYCKRDLLITSSEEWRFEQWADVILKECLYKGERRDVIKLVERLKLSGIHPDHIWEDRELGGSDDERAVYERWWDLQRPIRRYTFSDLILFCLDHLRRDETFRQRLRARYDDITVDEYQDVDPAQNLILQILASCPDPVLDVPAAAPQHRPSLIVVGDDDQAIYGFRGASPAPIRNFERTWGAVTFFMEENFRSQSQIIDCANRLIASDTGRRKKQLRATRGQAGTVSLLCPGSGRQTAETLETLHRGGLAWSDMACLFRVNALSCDLESSFTDEEIPYVLAGDEREGFYGLKPVRPLVAYLRLAQDEQNLEALAAVWNRPTRYLKNELLKDAQANCGSFDVSAVLDEAINRATPQQAERVRQLQRTLQAARTRADGQPIDLLDGLLHDLQYGLHLQALASSGATSFDDLNLCVERMRTDIAKRRTLGDFLRHVELMIANAKRQDRADAVKLMTLHRSKGLEFDTVVLYGMNEEVLPHVKAKLDEERRLAYVGVTRAKRRLYISTDPARASRFITDMGLVVPDAVAPVAEPEEPEAHEPIAIEDLFS